MVKPVDEYYYVFATNDYFKTDKYLIENILETEYFLGLQFLQGEMRGNLYLSEFASLARFCDACLS